MEILSNVRGFCKTASLFIVLFPVCVFAQTHTVRDLDKVIADSDVFSSVKEARIDSLRKAVLTSESEDELFWTYSALFNEYAYYQADSAMAYSSKMLHLPGTVRDSYKKYLANLSLIEEYIQKGMYYEARCGLDSISVSELPSVLLSSYYYKYNALYEALYDYSADSDLRTLYLKKEFEYKDSVLKYDPGNIFLYSAVLDRNGQGDSSLKILLDWFNRLGPDAREIGPVAYLIAIHYRQQGRRDIEKQFLIESAISDVKCSIKEYLSLRRLAEILYEEGDVNRSYSYIEKCLSDAHFCNARLRELQVSSIYPIFEAAYHDKQKKQIFLLTLSVLVIFLLLALCVILLTQKYQREKELDEANQKLAEASALKNIFISNLLLESVNRIDQLDVYRKNLNKKAISGDKAEVFAQLRSSTFIDEQLKGFYQKFDSVFLQIVPDFIQKVNLLMKPEHKFEQSKDSLPIELRILALIRLGIIESDRIASILKYSKATVYSYRSRMRLKSICPDTFESEIQKIKTI